MRQMTLCLIAMLLMGSCVHAPKTSPRLESFQEIEYQAYAVDGNGTITGETFLRTRGGGVKLGSGADIFLIPATAYNQEFVQREVLGGEKLTPSKDSRSSFYTRIAKADSRGIFRFEHVPAGSYFLWTVITWEVPEVGRYGIYSRPTGGGLAERVMINPGESKTVVLTR